MAKVIVMPKLGYTQDTGAIAEWLKNEGDTVERGEPLFDAQTDKSIITVEASCSGTLLKIALQAGETVPVLTPVAVIGDPSEDAEALLASHVTVSAVDAQDEVDFDDDFDEDEEEPAAAEASDKKLTPRAKKYMEENGLCDSDIAAVEGTGFEGGITSRDIKATPLAKKVAMKGGVDLSSVNGTGINGKIVKSDVKNAAATPSVSSDDEKKILSVTPYSGVRKIIGEKLAESKFTAPHLYFTDAVDTTNMTAFRKQLNEVSERKITVSDLLVYAAGKALQKYPQINSSLVDGNIICYKSANVGVAVAGDNGLVVPVIKNVQEKTLTDISAENRDLVDRAKVGRLKPQEYSDGTFSISNLGMFGIDNFTAIINKPESAILSVSSVRKKPIVIEEDGEDKIVIRPMMNIQLSVDHRVIDGLLAAQFVGYMKELLENPLKILM